MFLKRRSRSRRSLLSYILYLYYIIYSARLFHKEIKKKIRTLSAREFDYYTRARVGQVFFVYIGTVYKKGVTRILILSSREFFLS